MSEQTKTMAAETREPLQKRGGMPSPKRVMKPLEKRGRIFALLMLAIPFVNFLIFWVGVNANSIAMAFTATNTLTGEEEFSLYHFKTFFEEMKLPDNAVPEALRNTLKYFAIHIIKLFLSVSVAYFFYKKVPGHKIYKILLFLPSMIPGMVYINVFKQMISPYGPIYTFLKDAFGYTMPDLLSQVETATPTILFYVLWSGFGASMLIYVGAMNRIPEEVIDAANLDGCGMAREFFQIVMPLIWETFSTYLLLAVAGLFMETGPILYFTGNDTSLKTQTLNYWIFLQVKYEENYNYPAAIGLIFTVLGLPLVFISRWLMSKVDSVTY